MYKLQVIASQLNMSDLKKKKYRTGIYTFFSEQSTL